MRLVHVLLKQPALGTRGSPDALVGRLYAGRGRQQRLAENSPPRNTSFGTSTAHNQHHPYDGGDHGTSPVGGVPGLIRSRAAAAKAATSLVMDNSAEWQQQQQQQDLLVPRLHQQHSASSLLANSGGGGTAAADAGGGGGPQQQRGDGINSPPRIGLRRRSSGNSSTRSVRAPGTSSRGSRDSKSGVSAEAGYQPRRKEAASSAYQHKQQPSVGGGMTLSRSLGALGQAGAGRSTLAIVNTRDDGAPYLRSEKMSPKSSGGAGPGLSPKRSSPGGDPLR